MNRFFKLSLLMALMVALCCANSFGQATASGTILGTVTDKSGAVVTGAQVDAVNVATGARRSMTTGDTGNYRFDLLPVGRYNVKVTKPGFAAYSSTFELLVGQNATVDAVLNPGGTNEIVEVTSSAPLVDVAKTSVSQSITPTEVQELPMLGRDVANLAYLAPGVKATDSYDPTKNRYAILSVNGQGGRNVNVTVNGIDNKDNTVGGTVMQMPLEAVQEFVISTQRFSAANGRSEGAAINMVTKAGTNNYHGSLFGFFRDQSLNALDAQAAKSGADKPPYSRQQFGGSVGGPFKKDKLFGFFAFERQRESTSFAEDPDALSELTIASVIGAKPSPIIATPFYENRYNGRADYRLNDHHSAYFSYSAQNNNSLNDQSDGLGDLTGGNNTTNHLIIANLTVNSVLTPSLVNTFTAGYQFWNNKITSDIRVPYITFPSNEWFGTNVNVPQQSIQKKWQFKDDVTKTTGRHTLKAGVDYIWTPFLGGYFASNSTLEIDFNKDPSQIVALPNKFATAGLIDGMAYSNGDPSFTAKGGVKQLGLYFQDDFKVTKRLTLNLGVRWDKDINLVGNNSVLDSRTYQALKAINHPLTASLPHDDSKNFSPRVGFAYDLTGGGKHVIRGGFGIYYDNIFQNIPLFMQQQANATVYQGVFSIAPGNNCSASCVPGTSILLQNWRYGVDPMPTLPPPSTRLANGSTGRLMAPDYQNPYSEQFNFGYQWAVTSNSVFEAEYIHNLGLHENKSVSTNLTDPVTGVRPLNAALAAAGQPTFGRVTVESSINRSRYDGMNLSYRHRLTSRYQMSVNYTLSRAVGWDVGSPGTSFRNYPHDPRNPWSKDNFGFTPDDERHHVSVSGIVRLPAGFQVAPILQIGSARPYNVVASYHTLGLGSGLLDAVIVPTSAPTNYSAFASSSQGAAARACLSAGQCEIVPYNSLRGRPFYQVDMRLSKNWKFGEKANLETLFQAFNLTNHANYGNNFNGTAGSASFGTPNGFIAPSNSNIPHAFVGEFGFRFTF